MKTVIDIKNMSKEKKIIATKAMREKGIPIRKVAEVLDLAVNTVMVYEKKEIDKSLRQFCDILKAMLDAKDMEVAAKAITQIETKIDKGELKDLITLYKTLRELPTAGQPPQVAIQINQLIAKKREEYDVENLP
jgi:hypothetical protein